MLQWSSTNLGRAPHPEVARAPCPVPTATPVKAAFLLKDCVAQSWAHPACKCQGCGSASAHAVFWGKGRLSLPLAQGVCPKLLFLSWYWRAARRPLAFLMLDIPPRCGEGHQSWRGLLLRAASCTQSRRTPVQTYSVPPSSLFSLLGDAVSILLSITAAASAKCDIAYPFSKSLKYASV